MKKGNLDPVTGDFDPWIIHGQLLGKNLCARGGGSRVFQIGMTLVFAATACQVKDGVVPSAEIQATATEPIVTEVVDEVEPPEIEPPAT